MVSRMLADDACPTCALAKSSLAALAPDVAAEWHPTRNAIKPDEIAADHVMNAWWVCPNGDEYQATVRARTQGNRRCSTCYGGWSLENIRAFVKSLVGHLDKLNPSELFELAMQAGVLKDKGKPFVMALTNGKFPVAELEKFVSGQPSMVDAYASGGGVGGDALVLEPTERAEGELNQSPGLALLGVVDRRRPPLHLLERLAVTMLSLSDDPTEAVFATQCRRSLGLQSELTNRISRF